MINNNENSGDRSFSITSTQSGIYPDGVVLKGPRDLTDIAWANTPSQFRVGGVGESSLFFENVDEVRKWIGKSALRERLYGTGLAVVGGLLAVPLFQDGIHILRDLIQTGAISNLSQYNGWDLVIGAVGLYNIMKAEKFSRRANKWEGDMKTLIPEGGTPVR